MLSEARSLCSIDTMAAKFVASQVLEQWPITQVSERFPVLQRFGKVVRMDLMPILACATTSEVDAHLAHSARVLFREDPETTSPRSTHALIVLSAMSLQGVWALYASTTPKQRRVGACLWIAAAPQAIDVALPRDPVAAVLVRVAIMAALSSKMREKLVFV